MNNFEKWYTSILEDVNTEISIEDKVQNEQMPEDKIDPAIKMDREEIISDVNNILKSLETLAGEIKENSKEGLLQKAQLLNATDLFNEIESKLDWQLKEGTKLNSIYNQKLNLIRSKNLLTENKYTAISVKDKFKQLL